MKRSTQVQRKPGLTHLLVLVLIGLIIGCGGGQMPPGAVSQATGRATVTVTWPARTRLIPSAANAITVTLSQGSQAVSTLILARPATGNTAAATFNALPAGTLNVLATAHPNADGSGTAQAIATSSIVIQANQTTPLNLTMNSTIDHLVSAPSSLALNVGDVAAVTITAKDASGNTVLIKPQTLTWLSSNATVATVDSAGNVTGVAAGGSPNPVQITVTETESGKSVSIPVVVSTVTGTLIAYEPFNYPDRVGFGIDGATGGVGWTNWWGTAFLGTLIVVNANLTYKTLATSGNSVENNETTDPTPPSGPFGGCGGTCQNEISEFRRLASPLGQSGTVVYFSFLLCPLAPIGDGSSNYECGVIIGNLFVGKTVAGNNYGMTNGALTKNGYVGTQVSAQQNTTVFLVVRVTFKDGADQVDLWVDPTPGQPLPPTPDATKTDLDLGSVSEIGLDSFLGAQFDELRIGTTYSVAAPTH
jgi:hypothetical protein